MMMWTNDQIFEFLTVYESEPALWNSSASKHKNRDDVHDAWRRIQANFKGGTIPIAELKRKKENLMSTYRKLRNKINDSIMKDSDDVYKPEWPFYEKIAKFFDEIYKPRKSKTTNMISDDSEIDSKDEIIKNIDDDYTDDDVHEDISDEGDILSVPDEYSEVICKVEVGNTEIMQENATIEAPKKVLQKKRKLDETQNRTNDAHNDPKQLEQSPRKDVSSLYCDLLAAKLRRLQEDTRELAMLKIDNLLYKLKRREKKQNVHQPGRFKE